MSRNPFHYGTPVTGAQFVGRQREVEALVGRVRDGINVVLLSPRRYGKTSVLLRAVERLEAATKRPAIISVNVLRCATPEALAGRLAAGAFAIPAGRWHRAKQAVPEFVRRLRVSPSVTFGSDGQPAFTFSSAASPVGLDTVLGDVYGLLAAESATRPAALVLDEFQSITSLGAHLPMALKALADEYPTVSLVIAGSRQHLMDRLVATEAAPLYGMAQKLALGPIPDGEMAEFLCARALAGRKRMSPGAAQRIVELAGPVPNDIQRLAYEAFEVAGQRVDDTAIEDGMAQAVAHEWATYADLYGNRPPGQQRVLVALSTGGDDPPFSAAFVKRCGLANASSVKRALDALEQIEVAVERDGRWVVGDPFLAAWLRPLAA